MTASTEKNTAPGLADTLHALLHPDIGAAAGTLTRDASDLLPPEQAAAAACGGARRAEFITGRRLLRPLLNKAGLADFALLPGADRSPVWPDGWCGSISHSATHAVVALAKRETVAGIGLDLERVGRVVERLWERLFTPAERHRLESSRDPEVPATILFAAKEAYYKAQFPLTGAYLGFHDVEVVAGEGMFSVKDRREPGFDSTGRWAAVGGQVLAAVMIDPSVP